MVKQTIISREVINRIDRLTFSRGVYSNKICLLSNTFCVGIILNVYGLRFFSQCLSRHKFSLLFLSRSLSSCHYCILILSVVIKPQSPTHLPSNYLTAGRAQRALRCHQLGRPGKEELFEYILNYY